MAQDCIFCRIVRGEIPSRKVYEDDKVIVILDKYPADKGHMLVIPKQHYVNIFDAPPELTEYAFAVANRVARVWRRAGAVAANIVTNAGREANQSIFHIHIHVIPRWEPKNPIRFHGTEPLRDEEARQVVEAFTKAVQELGGLWNA